MAPENIDANPNEVAKRKAEAGRLFPFLLKHLPYLFAGGVLYGIIASVSGGLGLKAALFFCVISGIVCTIVVLPVIVLKWYLMRRDTSLTAQQQIIVGLGSWKVRAVISLAFTMFMAVGIVVSGRTDGDWFVLAILPIIIFLTLWMCYHLFKIVIPIPK